MEADPTLAEAIRQRFAAEIEAGRVVVENYLITTLPSGSEAPFYIHRGHSVRSQFARPSSDLSHYEEVVLTTKSVTDLIEAHGAPFYMKIDLEGPDALILRELFEHGIFPPYLSAEAHDIDVFCILVACGIYPSFKIMDGLSVGDVYEAHDVETDAGLVHHHFPGHSAGTTSSVPGNARTHSSRRWRGRSSGGGTSTSAGSIRQNGDGLPA